MTIPHKSIILIGVLLILPLVACSVKTPVATQTQPPSTAQSTQYPYPPAVYVNPSYPNPVTEPTVPVVVVPTPTADPQLGTVTGKLLLNNKGVDSVLLYLAEVIKDKTGKDVVAGLDRVNSPNTSTDTGGNFAFINVKPGRYAIILDVVTNQYMINYPDKKTPIIMDVVAGKVADVGSLNYDSLPLPPK